jgi:glycine oxidase
VIVNPDVLIIGGGVIGAACARALALTGRSVRLVERGEALGGAGWQAAAGLLAPQIEASDEDPLFDLGMAGREFYVETVDTLLETTGINAGLRVSGIVQLATGEARAEELRGKVAWQRQQGHLCDWLDATEVHERWPWVGASDGALWAPRDGSIHPERLVAALRADATRLGVQIITDEVDALLRDGDRVLGARGRDRHLAGATLLAAGAWSGRLANLPRPVSVEPVRGQMLAMPWPAGLEPGIVVGHGGYLLERDGEAVCGSTQEHAGFNLETTEAGQIELRDRARALCPTLGAATETRWWSGLRPGTPDGLPIIGREPTADGLWYATGHGRSGVLLAGVTGALIERLMGGEVLIEEAQPFRPDRFWSW